MLSFQLTTKSLRCLFDGISGLEKYPRMANLSLPVFALNGTFALYPAQMVSSAVGRHLQLGYWILAAVIGCFR